jgi:hypothetical protein
MAMDLEKFKVKAYKTLFYLVSIAIIFVMWGAMIVFFNSLCGIFWQCNWILNVMDVIMACIVSMMMFYLYMKSAWVVMDLKRVKKED